MTQDIIRMAREAGLIIDGNNSGDDDLFAFANLVATRAAALEREACAKVCEDEAWRLKKLAVDTNSSSTNSKAIQASNDADAIRARGNT